MLCVSCLGVCIVFVGAHGDDEKKATIVKYQAMSDADLDKFISESEATMEKTEADFKKFVDGLQKSYETENKAKDDTVEKIKASGLGFAKAVAASAAKKESSRHTFLCAILEARIIDFSTA